MHPMTLYRQIVIGIITLLVLGFAGTVVLSTNNLRTLLETQMGAHAQDTATSLGLSLSPHMQPRDMAIIESMVDAIFDRGYYSSIAITTLDGEILFERTAAADKVRAPDWFIDAVALRPPTAQALIMSGWKQTATIHVTSNPGSSYSELWSNTTDTFWLFLGSAALLLVIALLAVKVVLKPLQNVEIQAAAICNGSYPVQKKLPRTRELRSVVLAMNRLAEKIGEIFSEQAALAERLRKQAYMDPVTGLGNRRYFTRQLDALLESPDNTTNGALLLLGLTQLSRVNDAHGHTAGNELLARTATLISSRVKNMDNCITARITGAEYAIVVPALTRQDAEALAETICHDLLQLQADGLIEAANIGHVGIALWETGDTLADLLSEADIALRAAQTCERNSWRLHVPPATAQSEIQGEGNWHAFLKQALDTASVSLSVQPVYALDSNSSRLLHKEVLLRIINSSGTPVTAGIFMPMAERAGLASNIDRLAISKLLDFMENNDGTTHDYAINISSMSLHNSVFKDWLYSKLQEYPATARRLLVEFTEYSALVNMQDTRHFIERLAALGCRCGIDQFGRGFYSFGYLRSIKASYLKIDASYTRGIDHEKDNQFFIQSLTDTAHSIDIQVIAQSVETVEERNTMESMKLDGIQGFLTGRPEQL